jgi:hypothetical protein
MQAETGKVRGDISTELFYVTDLINFYGKQRREVHRRRNVGPTRRWSRRRS